MLATANMTNDLRLTFPEGIKSEVLP